jgi:crotonobetainyl-CoA:carnitine CoA-transferase CaiB-like acyl-CoA transferase
VQIADIAGGGMNGVIGILLALHERNRSGKGQYIDISMTDGVLGLLTLPLILQKKTGMKQKRSQSMLSHRYGCYNTYMTADGGYLALGAVENRFWRNLCHILGIEQYGELQYNEESREEIIEKLRMLFLEKPLAHWEEVLAGADVCYSKIQNIEEVLADRLFVSRGMIEEMPGSNSGEKTFGVPVKLSRTPGTLRNGPQSFGGSTRDVLSELGYTEETIQFYFDTGVV